MAAGVRSVINMAHQATPSSQKALMMELKSLQEQPVEGFRITLVEESDLYNWEVAIFGPPNTLYEGGYFKVRHNFSNSRREGWGWGAVDTWRLVEMGETHSSVGNSVISRRRMHMRTGRDVDVACVPAGTKYGVCVHC